MRTPEYLKIKVILLYAYYNIKYEKKQENGEFFKSNCALPFGLLRFL